MAYPSAESEKRLKKDEQNKTKQKPRKMGSIPEVSIIKGLNHDNQTQQLHRIFEANLNSSNCGNKPAIIYSDRIDGDYKLTYNQLNHASNRIAAVLIDQINTRKLEPNPDGDWIIAVCMPPSNELIITLLAILKTGAAYLPIDTTFPKSRIDHILQEAKPAFVIYDNNTVERSLFSSPTVLSFAECNASSSMCDCGNITDDRMLQSDSGTRLALVLYTSGSTGVPKGVRLPHAVIMNRLQWQWETFPYSSTEQIGVFKTALTFVDSISEIWGPLLTKNAVLIVPKCVTKDPTQLVAILQKYEIERLVLVPTLLKSLLIYLSLKQDVNLLSKLKLWVCSGETLPVSLANEFYDYFPENEYLLCNFYGSTEIMGDVTYFICRGKDQLCNYNNVPIGYPIFNTNIYILDAERKPVKVGETGELFVSGANLAHGYVNGRDKERFIENVMAVDPKFSRMYQTGDYASVQKGGIIHYEGRTDSQVKIRGHRVDLSEIEKQLLEIDGVKKGIVLCYHAGQMDQAILAFASVETSSQLHELQIEKMLQNKLPEYMTPQVIIIDQVPLLVNGKIDRQTLLKMYENTNNNDDPEPAIDYDFTGVSPNQMQIATILFETIGDVIGRSARATISLESNFYALGGNSLNSIYTVAKLRDRGYSIEITNFISATNLRETLDYMTEIEQTEGQNIQPSENKGNFTASPLEMEHKKQTIHIISHSFLEKAELEQQLKPNIRYSDYVELLDAIWQPLVEKAYSFIIKDEQNRIVGVALNFDANDEPEAPCIGPLSVIFEFLDFVEVPIKNQLPNDKPIMHSFMMGTHESLNAQENIVAMTFMESEVIRLAKERNCCGILTTNTNALTQQLARNVYGYETLLDYQVNQYISDGNKPFGTAPDNYRALVQWKKL